MSTKRNLRLLERAREKGYFIRCYYILTADPIINVWRVKSRVASGGHDVPEEYTLDTQGFPHPVILVHQGYNCIIRKVVSQTSSVSVPIPSSPYRKILCQILPGDSRMHAFRVPQIIMPAAGLTGSRTRKSHRAKEQSLNICNPSHNCLNQYLVLHRDLLKPGLFLLIKIEAKHITFFQMIIIQIISELFFPSFIIGVSSPHF